MRPECCRLRCRKFFPVARDERVSDQAKVRQGGERSFFVDPHQTAIARDVGGEDGDKPSLERRRFHFAFPNFTQDRRRQAPEG